MPYLLCLLSKSSYEAPIFRNGYYSWDSALYAPKPNLKDSGNPYNVNGIQVTVIVLAAKDSLVDTDYMELYRKNLAFRCHTGFNNEPEVMYCLKVNSFDDKQLGLPFELTIKSPKDIIGFIAFPSPRICDGEGYCTTHALAEQSDRDAFLTSVIKRYELGSFLKRVIRYENTQFDLPEKLIKSKDERKAVTSTAKDLPATLQSTGLPPSKAPSSESGITSFLSNIFSRNNTVNKELDELFSRAKQNQNLAMYLLSQAKEFDKKAETQPRPTYKK